jgi:ribosome-associated protein
MPEELAITRRVVIPGSDLELSWSRSGGPGGQKVNKTESRVQLSFDLDGTEALSEAVKSRVRARFGSRINREGRLLLACDTHRERTRNLEEVRARLAAMIRGCLEAPRPRRATKPSRAAKRRRVEAKTRRGQIKKLRGPPRHDD